jgi:hypothetical protein
MVNIEKIWCNANEIYLKNAPSNYNVEEGKKYVGIAVTTTDLPRTKLDFVYGFGILLLIEHFKSMDKPFKLIKDVKKENFSELVNNPNCNELYILGHGTRRSLLISEEKSKKIFKKPKKKSILYEEFKNSPKKDKVAQLHCIHKKDYHSQNI